MKHFVESAFHLQSLDQGRNWCVSKSVLDPLRTKKRYSLFEVKLLLPLIFIAVSNCSSPEKSGFRQTFILTCRHWTNQCYRQGTERCPRRGFDVISHSETLRNGGRENRYREYTLTIACKD